MGAQGPVGCPWRAPWAPLGPRGSSKPSGPGRRSSQGHFFFHQHMDLWDFQAPRSWAASCPSNSRNPLHFDTIEGRRSSVSDTLFSKIRVPDSKTRCQTLFVSKTASHFFLRPSMHMGCGSRSFPRNGAGSLSVFDAAPCATPGCCFLQHAGEEYRRKVIPALLPSAGERVRALRRILDVEVHLDLTASAHPDEA